MEAFSQTGDSVTLNLKGPDGERETVRADWLVACDGGASFIRRTLNVPFEGKTAPNQWIVIDIANDPLATPHVYLCCDPVRPYVSAALPHGVRRFEFMVMPGETEAQLSEPHNMRRLLSKVLPDPDRVELIRQRVYTHNARLAERFRIDRVLLAGDAAHIMPVWQGRDTTAACATPSTWRGSWRWWSTVKRERRCSTATSRSAATTRKR